MKLDKKSFNQQVLNLENQKEKSLRYNDGKLKWSLVHFKSLEPMVRVLMHGVNKYTHIDEKGNVISGADNWKKGLNKKEILESAMRHLTALMDDEQIDFESNLEHVGHLMCNCMFYQYHSKNGN